MLSASLYFHTLRYLRPQQVLARLRYRLVRRRMPARAAPPLAQADGRWILPPGRAPALLGPARVRFLSRERELSFPEDWQAGGESLWLYNLHYFDDLNAARAVERTRWHQDLIAGWIRDNPAAQGVGWEPYPTSLRLVNWIKWSLAGNQLDRTILTSLATQLRFLRTRIEWHLLGNHVLANAKAMVFGGLFFTGNEADEWLEFGGHLLREQILEQFLPDGGHFERSPMYHGLALEDVLDVMNLMRAYSARPFSERSNLSSLLPGMAAKMVAWLEAMTHPDGEIAFFNDASTGVALPLAVLRAYGADLGVSQAATLVDMQSSGYVRFDQGIWCAFFDAATIGPDYQPGHAHADTLSFELSVDGERLISNSGTSTYELGVQRAYERSTRAHNTVEVDGENSSEVWAAFRVARRARPFERTIELGDRGSFVSCAHDGYFRLRGRPVHRRQLELTAQAVCWTDRVEGGGTHSAKGFIPLHPNIEATIQGAQAMLVMPSSMRLVLSGEGISGFRVEEGSYACEFGLAVPRPTLTWELAGPLPLEARFTLIMDDSRP